jgi:hypothetical protein
VVKIDGEAEKAKVAREGKEEVVGKVGNLVITSQKLILKI